MREKLLAMRVDDPSNLMDNDQQRPAAYAMDVAVNGQWIVQHDDSGDVASKPPLYPWLAGLSIMAVIDALNRQSRRNAPHDIRVATVYFKPGNNRTDRRPDYYIHETDKWLVFPHELKGLTDEEIARHKPDIARIIQGRIAR